MTQMRNANFERKLSTKFIFRMRKMHFLVKRDSEVRKVYVNKDTLDELVVKCCGLFGEDPICIDISLNGRDPLSMPLPTPVLERNGKDKACSAEQFRSSTDSLRGLGLTNGDRLYIIRKQPIPTAQPSSVEPMLVGEQPTIQTEEFMNISVTDESLRNENVLCASVSDGFVPEVDEETESKLVLDANELNRSSSLSDSHASDDERSDKLMPVRGFADLQPITSIRRLSLPRSDHLKQASPLFMHEILPASRLAKSTAPEEVPLSLERLFGSTMKRAGGMQAASKLLAISVLCDLAMREEGFERCFLDDEAEDEENENCGGNSNGSSSRRRRSKLRKQQAQTSLQLHFRTPSSALSSSTDWHCCIILSTVGDKSNKFAVHTGLNFPLNYSVSSPLLDNMPESSSAILTTLSLEYLKPFFSGSIIGEQQDRVKPFDRYYISHAYSGHIYSSAALMYRNLNEFTLWFKAAVVFKLKALVSYQILSLPYPSPYSLSTTLPENARLLLLCELPTITDVIRLCSSCNMWCQYLNSERYWYLWKYFTARDFGKAVVAAAEQKLAADMEQNPDAFVDWKTVYKREHIEAKKKKKKQKQFSGHNFPFPDWVFPEIFVTPRLLGRNNPEFPLARFMQPRRMPWDVDNDNRWPC